MYETGDCYVFCGILHSMGITCRRKADRGRDQAASKLAGVWWREPKDEALRKISTREEATL